VTPSEIHRDCLICKWHVEPLVGDECQGRRPSLPCAEFEPTENRNGTRDRETGDELPGSVSKSEIGMRAAVLPLAAPVVVAGSQVPPRLGPADFSPTAGAVVEPNREAGGHFAMCGGGGGDEVLMQIRRGYSAQERQLSASMRGSFSEDGHGPQHR
jgi:hypothetical protein